MCEMDTIPDYHLVGRYYHWEGVRFWFGVGVFGGGRGGGSTDGRSGVIGHWNVDVGVIGIGSILVLVFVVALIVLDLFIILLVVVLLLNICFPAPPSAPSYIRLL